MSASSTTANTSVVNDASLNLVKPVPTTICEEMAANPETANHKALDHLLKYQWFRTSYNWVTECKYVHLLAQKTGPSVQKVKLFKPILYSANVVNNVCDYKLTQVDRVVDLTSAQIDDLTRLIRGTLGMVELVAVKGVYEPAVQKVDAVGVRVHSLLHNDKGQAIVPSIADPIVSPVNVVLEKGVKKLSPEKAPVEKQSSELKRTWKLIGSSFSKLKAEQPPIEVEEPAADVAAS